MSKLPTGWAVSSLKELLTKDGVFSDGDWVESKDQDPSGSIRLLQLADIGDGYFVDKSNRFINEQKFVELRCTELFEHDLLIARMPDPLGRACLMPKLPQRCVTVVDVAIVRTGRGGVSGNWLMHTINAPQYRAEIELNSSGTTRKRISRGNLAVMPMPVPPTPEQKRIANKLDSVLARVDACRDRLDRFPALLKRFRQSILAAATSGRLTEDWRMQNNCNGPVQVTLRDILKVSSGNFLPAKNMADGGEIPVYGGNGVNGYHNESNVSEETLVIGRVGHYCGSVHLTPMQAWVTDNALIVRHEQTETNRRFLFYALQAVDLRVNDSSTAQPVISGQKIYPLEIKLPSLDEQLEIVRRVDLLFAFANRLEARLLTARKQVGQLTPSLLAKAFRGELVPQDPDDEPASVLLERIRASREASEDRLRSRQHPAS